MKRQEMKRQDALNWAKHELNSAYRRLERVGATGKTRYIEVLEMVIEVLEQEPCDIFDEYGNYKYPGDIELSEPNTATSIPCGDAISFEAVKNTMFMVQRTAFISDNEFHRTMDLLMRLPSVNPQEPKTGHWIKRPHGFKCSRCLIVHSHTSIFCPSCGMKMIEPPESEDKE